MTQLNSKQIATKGILTILSLIMVFHLLIVFRVIPYQIVWGGRLKNVSQMLIFEAVSIIMNVLMLAVVSIHAGILKVKINRTVLRIALGAMCVLFALNTVGNLFSYNELEKILFTPLTLVLALFSLRLAIDKAPVASS